MAAGTQVGTGYVQIAPDFTGFQEKVGKKLAETLGPAMDRAGANANKKLSKSLTNNTSLRSSFQPLLKRFQKFGDDAGEEIASRIGRSSQSSQGDMFGLAGAIQEVGRRSKPTATISAVLERDMFGVAKAAVDAGKGYQIARSGLRDWGHEAHAAESAGKRLANGVKSLFSDLRAVGRNLKASAGGFGSFEGIMAKVNRVFTFFRNIWSTIRFPTLVAGVSLLAQSLSALAAGAVATISALAPLSGALIALPAAALMGAQAFGTLKLAMMGIGNAVKAAVTAQVRGGEQATQALRQQENAAEAVADAHRTLASSERDERYAQEDLTKARKEATRQLQDMRLASEESNLTEREGALALRESRRELNKTLRDPKASGLDVQSAEQAVEQAKFSLEETRLDAKRARSDYADAQKKGVEGMPEVVAAKRSLADSNRAVADAERGVAKAVRENSDAMKQQGSAATALQQKMALLTPTGRKFARFLISLKPQFDALRETAAKGLLPGAEKGLKSTLGNLGIVKKIVGETSGALGKLAAKAGAKLGSEAWGRDLGKLGEMNTRILTRAGDAALNFGDALRNILVSAEPLLEWMSKGTLELSEWVKSSAQAGRETGRLGHFFGETREAMERVWRILKPLGEGLLNIGEAAKPLGNEILDSLGNAAEGWAKWTGSTEGQNKLRNYFVEVKPAIFAIGRLVRDMTDDFAELGRQKGVATLVETIRTKLLPLFRNGAGVITGFLSGFIDRFDDLRREGVPTFDAFVQTLAEHAGEGAVKIANALVRGFLNASPLGKLAIGGWLMSKFGGIGAFTKLGKYVGGQFGVGVEAGAAGSAGAGIETKVAGSLGGRLKSGFVSLGKQLGYAMVAYGLFSGVYGAISERKAAHGLTDNLHNFAVSVFKGFGLPIGESTAEEFAKGFKKEIENWATTGALGVQSIITPQIEDRAKAQAEQAVPGGEGATGFEEAYERAISNIMQDVQSRRASARELFSNFWRDMGPDEKTFARQLRNALVQSERLVQRTGIKIPKLKLETDPQGAAVAVRKMFEGFTFLRKGFGNNLGDISRVSKRTAEAIKGIGGGTKETRELTARNMKLTAEAIAKQMDRSGDYTKKGLDRIKELIRNADLLAPTRKMAAEFGGEWAKQVATTKTATKEAVERIIGEARRMPGPMRKIALETWLEQITQARKSGKLTAEAFRDMRSKLFAEFGVFRKGSKAFNQEVAEGFIGMVNQSGGALNVLMENVSGLLGKLKGGKLNWKIIDARLSKDPNGASLGRQRGGSVRKGLANGGGLAGVVPGNSTGDRHVLALNGTPIAKVESREGIFVGNRKMMAAAKAANDAVPRFQGGGLVGKVQQPRQGGVGEPKLAGPDGALKQLGKGAIHQVFEGAKDFLGTMKSKVSAAGAGAVDLSGIAGSVASQAAQIAKRAHSPFRSTLALFEALWAESSMGSASPGNVLQALEPYTKIRSAAEEIAGFLTGTPAWTGTAAIPLARSTSLPANAIAQLVQKSGVGDGNEGRANYLQAKDLALATMQKFGFNTPGMALGGLLHPAVSGGGRSASWDWNGVGPSGLQSGIRNLAAYVMNQYPGLSVTSTTGGSHVSGSLHYTGQAVDLASGDYGYMDKAAGWIKSSGLYKALAEGIHNPNLSVDEGNLVDPSFYSAVWADHRNHIHLGVTHPWQASGFDGGARSGAGGKQAASTPKKPKEKVPATFKGAKTGRIDFGPIPGTLEAVNAEIKRWEPETKVYRRAKASAEKAGKPDTAKAIGENLTLIEARLRGLQQRRTALRFKEVKKRLTKRLSKATRKMGGYQRLIEEAERGYSGASQYAEQMVALEPQSPELPESATDAQREAAEKADVANYTSYIDQRERPALSSVLDRVADWRNKILGAEIFGFGKGNPSVVAMQTTWEKQTREADSGIDQLRAFAKKVLERKDDWVRGYEHDHKGKHPKESDYPPWLTQQLQERKEDFEQKLPILTLKDTQLRQAVQEAREQFFPGGNNRLAPNSKGVPAEALPGSGSLEEELVNVQGIHPFPEQHSPLDAGGIGPPNSAGRFGGVIWDVNSTFEELGVKIREATSGLAAGASGGSGEDDSELVSLLREIAERERKGRLVSETLSLTSDQFFKAYPGGMPPLVGTFHSGGIVPGPTGAEGTAIVRAGERIRTVEQELELAQGIREAAGSANPGDLHIRVHGDIISDRKEPITVEEIVGDRRFKRAVRVTKGGRPTAGGARR